MEKTLSNNKNENLKEWPSSTVTRAQTPYEYEYVPGIL